MRTKSKAQPVADFGGLVLSEPAPIEGAGPLTNVPEVTVSELSGALKRTVEERFGYVRLRGEVSNYRGPHSSGHAYFSLKDATARIDAVVWRTAFAKMRIKPEEGMEVLATGKVTTFPGKSSYQIVIDTLEPAGLGALMAMLEERRQRFAAEGLFDASRKRPLPFLPESIGVITSPTGAVIRDILHRIAGRFPRRVLIWPVRVQGEGSAAEVAAAIRGFGALEDTGPMARPHLLIVARGGGSLEDLWGFNDEAVVRAAAASLIPVVSAIGHETDWTLLDHVADLRAPTPTGAAELAVPVRAELLADLDRLSARHAAGMLRLLDRNRDALRATARALPSGADLLANSRQRLDQLSAQLPAGLRRCADRRRLDLVRLAGRLAAQAPQARLARDTQTLHSLASRLSRAQAIAAERRQHQVAALSQRLATALSARLGMARQDNHRTRDRLAHATGRLRQAIAAQRERRVLRLEGLAQMLASLGYRSVLNRGYALVRDEAGQAVPSPREAPAGAILSIEFAEGLVKAEVLGSEGAPKSRGKTQGRSAPKTKVEQGSLF